MQLISIFVSLSDKCWLILTDTLIPCNHANKSTNNNVNLYVFTKLKLLKLKLNKAIDENSSLSYGTSPAIW